MPVALYMDVHVPQAITEQLRLRGVDVITAIEDHSDTITDEDLLERARTLGRVVFTQDLRFKGLAEAWQRQARGFADWFSDLSWVEQSATSCGIWS